MKFVYDLRGGRRVEKSGAVRRRRHGWRVFSQEGTRRGNYRTIGTYRNESGVRATARFTCTTDVELHLATGVIGVSANTQVLKT